MLRSPWPEVALLLLTLAWGLSFVVIPRALEDCGPFTLTALRMGVGTVAALALLRPRLLSCGAATWRHGLLGGLFLAIAYVLQTYGMQTASPGEGGFLTAFYVALVPVIEAAVFRRAPARRNVVLLGVATAGIFFIAVDPAATGGPFSVGSILLASSAVFWAAQIVVVGRAAAAADPAALATIQVAVIAVLAAAALPFVGEKPVVWSRDLGMSVFFLGYVTCALAFAAQAWAQKLIAPTRVAILFSPEPVFAALAGWYFVDEAFGPRKLAGAALVLTAVALALVPSRRRPDRAGAVA